MMREYSKISPKLWRSPRFRDLASDDARLFYLYTLTCGHQTSAGCFRAPDAYVASDLAWSESRVVAARAEAIETGLIVHDPATDEYFVPRWLQHNPTTNGKHLKGVERLISQLDSDHVREAAEYELDEHASGRNGSEGVSERLPNGNHLTQTGYLNGKRA